MTVERDPNIDSLTKPECDLARRRRFLRVALVGGAALGLGNSALAAALVTQQDGTEPFDSDGCTKTETYSSSYSSTTSYPSLESCSYSYLEDCYYDGTSSSSHINSWSFIGQYVGYHSNSSTYRGTGTTIWAEPGGATTSTSCKDGTRTVTISDGSVAAFTNSYSGSEIGTRTATCEDDKDDKKKGGFKYGIASRNDGTSAEATTQSFYDAPRSVLEAAARHERCVLRIQERMAAIG